MLFVFYICFFFIVMLSCVIRCKALLLSALSIYQYRYIKNIQELNKKQKSLKSSLTKQEVLLNRKYLHCIRHIIQNPSCIFSWSKCRMSYQRYLYGSAFLLNPVCFIIYYVLILKFVYLKFVDNIISNINKDVMFVKMILHYNIRQYICTGCFF